MPELLVSDPHVGGKNILHQDQNVSQHYLGIKFLHRIKCVSQIQLEKKSVRKVGAYAIKLIGEAHIFETITLQHQMVDSLCYFIWFKYDSTLGSVPAEEPPGGFAMYFGHGKSSVIFSCHTALHEQKSQQK